VPLHILKQNIQGQLIMDSIYKDSRTFQDEAKQDKKNKKSLLQVNRLVHT
jgi:hypothetical protein